VSTNNKDPWNTDESDSLDDLASAIDVFKEQTDDQCAQILITENCPFYKDIIKGLDYEGAPMVIVVKGASVGWSQHTNVGTLGHCDHRGKSVVQTAIDSIREAELALTSLDRRYITVVHDKIPKLKKSVRTNKPYYRQFEKRKR